MSSPRRNYGSARVRVPAARLDADSIFMRGLLAGFALGTVPCAMLALFFFLEG